MKLKAKFEDEDIKLGEVVDAVFMENERIQIKIAYKAVDYFYDSIDEFRDKWEDYEGPKEYWYIDCYGDVLQSSAYYDNEWHRKRKQIGNYFETKEEAEKAVEKLKALTKLCKKGFEFDDVEMFGGGIIRIEASIPINEKTTLQERSGIVDDLGILFGGEE